MGWVGETNFLPGLANDIVLDTPDMGSMALAAAYTPSGSMDEWKKAAHIVRKSTLARLQLAAAFASPLVSKFKLRNYLIHVWGPSKGGKTAGLHAALSAWGDPEKLLASFNATRVGLELTAAFYSDLPLGIDERQMAQKQEFLEGLAYVLGSGRGKIRGAKGGGTQFVGQWKMMCLTTGEEPIANDSSSTGVKTRTLEFNGVPFVDQKDSQEIYSLTANNYGHAGPEFIRRFIAGKRGMMGVWGELLGDYKLSLKNGLAEANIDIPHLDALSLLALADSLYSQWLLGVPKDQAEEEAAIMVADAAGYIVREIEDDYILYARDYIHNWLQSNEDHFRDQCISPRFGYKGFNQKHESYCWYVYPHIFKRALEEARLSPRRVLNDFLKEGVILGEKNGSYNRADVKVNGIPFNSARYIVVPAMLNSENDEE